MIIECLEKKDQENLDKCLEEISAILDKYFPDIRHSYPEDFNERLSATMLLELIQAGYIKTQEG